MTTSTPPLRILITNDDGMHAPGIELLEQIALTMTDDVWVVAPDQERSGAGHSISLTLPIRMRQLGPKRFQVAGTPTDCVLMALSQCMTDGPPTLLLSGINSGANLAEDVTYSGTIAAAMEGTLFGIRSIALSQVRAPGTVADFAPAAAFCPDLLRKVVALADWPPGSFININFPERAPEDVAGIAAASQGKHKLGDDLIMRSDPRGRTYLWIGPQRNADISAEGTDLKAVDEGYIAVTPLNVDLTHRPTMDRLRDLIRA